MLKEAWPKRGDWKKTSKDEEPSNGCSDRQLGVKLPGGTGRKGGPKAVWAPLVTILQRLGENEAKHLRLNHFTGLEKLFDSTHLLNGLNELKSKSFSPKSRQSTVCIK
jgi:hypothetical protein